MGYIPVRSTSFRFVKEFHRALDLETMWGKQFLAAEMNVDSCADDTQLCFSMKAEEPELRLLLPVFRVQENSVEKSRCTKCPSFSQELDTEAT